MTSISGEHLREASNSVGKTMPLSLSSHIRFKSGDGKEVSVSRQDIETYCPGIQDMRELFGKIEEPIALPDDITSQDISNGLHALRFPDSAKQLDLIKLLILLKVGCYLPAKALIELVDQALSEVVGAHVVTTRHPPCILDFQEFREPMNYQTAIEYILKIQKEFAAHLDSLPKTQAALTQIVTVVFEKMCQAEAKKQKFSLDLLYDYDLSSTYDAGLTERQYQKLFTIFFKRYEDLASKISMVNFSFYREYLWLHGTLPIYVSEEVCRLYQQLIELSSKHNPRDQHALEMLGSCHQWSYDSEKYVKAKSALETALELSQTPEAVCTLALLLFHGGQGVEKNPERALELLNKRVQGTPSEIEYVTLAYLLKESGKLSEAQRLLAKFENILEEVELVNDKRPTLLFTYANYLQVLAGKKLSEERKMELYLVNSHTPDYFQQLLMQAVHYHGGPDPDLEAIAEQDVHIARQLKTLVHSWSFPLVKDLLKSFPQAMKQTLLSYPDIKRLYDFE